MVVCLRSARHWGLGKGRHGSGLLVPAVSRGGHLLAEGVAGLSREDVVGAVQSRL